MMLVRMASSVGERQRVALRAALFRLLNSLDDQIPEFYYQIFGNDKKDALCQLLRFKCEMQVYDLMLACDFAMTNSR